MYILKLLAIPTLTKSGLQWALKAELEIIPTDFIVQDTVNTVAIPPLTNALKDDTIKKSMVNIFQVPLRNKGSLDDSTGKPPSIACYKHFIYATPRSVRSQRLYLKA